MNYDFESILGRLKEGLSGRVSAMEGTVTGDILQAVAATGAISLQASMYILFGQNIGTCVTALMASVGTSRTAKRAAVVHLLFNVIGTVVFTVLTMVLPLADWIITLAGENQRFQIALI